MGVFIICYGCSLYSGMWLLARYDLLQSKMQAAGLFSMPKQARGDVYLFFEFSIFYICRTKLAVESAFENPNLHRRVLRYPSEIEVANNRIKRKNKSSGSGRR